MLLEKNRLVKDLQIRVSRRAVLKALGYREKMEITSRVEEILREVMEEGEGFLRIRGIYSVWPVERVTSSGIRLSGGTEFSTQRLAGVFREAEAVAVLLATIGPELEGESGRLSEEGHLAQSLVLDTFGSEAAEAAIAALNRRIDDRAGEEKRRTTFRFSPGYCDWDIKEQEKVFTLLDGGKVGVRLSPSVMMIPRKSVSAIVGIGSRGSVKNAKHYPSPCPDCPQRFKCLNKR